MNKDKLRKLIDEENDLSKLKDEELKRIEREEELIKTIERGLEGQESRAKRINELIGKLKGWLSQRQKVVDFKEPCAILMRNGMTDEFYEDVSKGKMRYVHSNGEEQFIIIDPRYLRSMPYGGKVVRYYLLHEDYPLPLPEDPALSAEKFNLAIEKISSIEKEWRAKELKKLGDMWWKILTGIAIVIGVLGFIGISGGFEWIANIFNKEEPIETGRTATTIIPGMVLFSLTKIKEWLKR